MRKDLGNGERRDKERDVDFSYIVFMFIKPLPFPLLFSKIAFISRDRVSDVELFARGSSL